MVLLPLCSLGLKDPHNYKYCVSLLMLVCSLEESEVNERLSNLSCVLEGSCRWACALRVPPSSVRRCFLVSCPLFVQTICQMPVCMQTFSMCAGCFKLM